MGLACWHHAVVAAFLVVAQPAWAREIHVNAPYAAEVLIRHSGQDTYHRVADSTPAVLKVDDSMYDVRVESHPTFFQVARGEQPKVSGGMNVTIPMTVEVDTGRIALVLVVLLPVVGGGAWWTVRRTTRTVQARAARQVAEVTQAMASVAEAVSPKSGTRLPVGTRVGAYKILGFIARGGMGSVYEVEDGYGDHFALKLPDAEGFTEDESRRFFREIEISRQLHHPNIILIHDFNQGDEGVPPFIVLDLVDGGSLRDLMARERPMSLPRVYYYVRGILEALRFGHGKGIIHRDIKPANILLTREGIPKVADYGIARAVNMKTVTQTASVVGTPTYMSPEQIRSHRVDPRADLYAVGVIMFEALTGHLPFESDDEDGEDPMSLLFKKVTQNPPHLYELNAQIPPAIDALCMIALAGNPEDRFASADEFIAALDEQRPLFGA